jgi:dihydrofolate reductase
MGKVISGISMSLDGFVTGPNVTREQQLGDGGEILHRWLHEPDPRDSKLLAGMGENVGSILMGRRSYDLAEGDGGWADGGPAGPAPCFVLTHNPPAPETVRAPSVFTFVTDGIHSAVEQAKAAAGDKVVGVHGASAAQHASPSACWTRSSSASPRFSSAAAPGCSSTWAARSGSSAPT